MQSGMMKHRYAQLITLAVSSFLIVASAAAQTIKVGPLPVKLQIQGQYMPVHPDVFGQKWNLQFAVTPVIPKLIRGHLLRD
jgi:hypothetical protein